MRKNMRRVKLGERRCPDVSHYQRRFYTDLDLNALCGGWHFSFLVFMHAFMSYKVRRIVGLRATKKARKRSARKLRAGSFPFEEQHPIDESGVAFGLLRH